MIRNIKLKNFRNYKTLDLDIDSGLNLFIGANGQGKTNLLEAIFFAAMLRSFRTSHVRDIKRIGGKGFYIGIEATAPERKWTRLLEVEYDKKRKLKIDDVPVHKASEFIRELRTVAFSPDDINIVTGNSSIRRRFVDMFISIMVPGYMAALHSYLTAIKARNAVLKNAKAEEAVIAAYEPIIAETGVFIVKQRQFYIHLLAEEMVRLLREFHDRDIKFEIRYKPDFSGDLGAISTRLKRERKRDMLRGFTGSGPQLDDIELFYNGKLMRNFASTGQCRLVSLCLKMAKVNILAADSSFRPENIIVLVDDVTGELDENTRNAFFQVINRAGQAFFTFTESPDDAYFKDADIFQVNNGQIPR